MRIGVLGYGRMGRMVEEIAQERDHEVMILPKGLDGASNVDVIIEFTRPDQVIENMYHSFEMGIPIVTGTTGWNERLAEVSEKCKESAGSLFHSSNFSLGVHLFNAINRHVAQLMNGFKDYQPSMEEIHHTGKLDSPSGTAITLAETMIPLLDSKDSWSNESDQDPTVLEIISKREPEVPGTHSITYSSSEDEIVIRHRAKNRRGFALGAVLAAEWLSGRKGVYSMSDMLKLN